MLETMTIVALVAAAPGPEAYREAIVIGSNHPLPGSDYDILRYADDDALRFATFFEELGIPAQVFTVVDEDSVERFGALARTARRPTRAAVLEELGRLRERFDEAEGRERELYFVFSGHGSVTASRAYLHLFDGPFSRTDVFEHILRAIPAERIHVVIDSCHSYFLVNARGERTVAETDTEDLDRYPHAGFLLSTSDRREVQEWDGYRAGVFSYQVLGALRGAADVNRDGRVTYPEVHAYVTAANLEVTNPTARIRPFVRRPSVPGDELADLRGRELTVVGDALAGHFYVADDERGRVLDAHKPDGEALALLLPKERSLYVRDGTRGFRIRTSTTTGANVLEAAPELAALSTKGSPADEFRTNLFKVPLTADFVLGLDAATRSAAAPRVAVERSAPWYADAWTVALLSSGAAAIVFGGVATAVFVDARNTANGPLVQLEGESETDFLLRIRQQDDAAGRSGAWQGAMIGGFAAGGALLVGGIVHALSRDDDDRLPLAVSLPIGGPGLAIGGRF